MFSSIINISLVVSGQYGWPVKVISPDRGTVTIFTSSGEQILEGEQISSLGRGVVGYRALFVLEDGTVLICSMFGIYKTTFSMGQYVSSNSEPRVRKLYDCGELPAGTSLP